MDNKLRNTDIRKDIIDAINKAFPDCFIDWPIDFEESCFGEIYPKIETKLSQIKGTELNFERDPEGGPQWAETSDPDEDPPDWCDNSFSYHLFFISLTDEKFKYITEDGATEDKGVLHRVEGVGMIGCAVAVSLLAPFAVISLNSMDRFENGEYTCPDIDPQIFTENGEPIDMETFFSEMMGEEALQSLQSLCVKITTILESFGILILPEEEAQKPVKWLRAGEEAFLGKKNTGRDITVQDAFFFRGM